MNSAQTTPRQRGLVMALLILGALACPGLARAEAPAPKAAKAPVRLTYRYPFEQTDLSIVIASTWKYTASRHLLTMSYGEGYGFTLIKAIPKALLPSGDAGVMLDQLVKESVGPLRLSKLTYTTGVKPASGTLNGMPALYRMGSAVVGGDKPVSVIVGTVVSPRGHRLFMVSLLERLDAKAPATMQWWLMINSVRAATGSNDAGFVPAKGTAP